MDVPDAEVKPIWAQPRQPKDAQLPQLTLPASANDSGTEVESADEDDIPDAPIQDMHTMHTTTLPQEVEVEEVHYETVESHDGSKETPPKRKGLFKDLRNKLKKGATTSMFRKTTSQSEQRKTTTFLNRSSTLAKSVTVSEELDHGWRTELALLVQRPSFELTFAVIIFINTILMAVQVQYRGLNVGYFLQYPGVQTPATESWPHAEPVFFAIEMCFGVIFTLEILIKILALDIKFLYDPWNILDFLVVLAWFVDTISQGLLPLDPLLLRLLRLVKLFRMLRLVRTIQGFDSLYVMITAIRGSVAALFWSTMLLLLVLTTVSLFLQTMMEPYISGSEEEVRRREVYMYYGTFSKAMVSLCEMTLANWPTPSRVLTENVSEVWIFFVLSYQLLVGFSVMKVIMGVFLQITFYVASNDDVIMMSQKERAVRVHTKKMEALFEAADENGNGRLDQEEFESILLDPACVAWLSAMGLEASLMSGKDLYKLLCAEGTDDLSANELCTGVAELKGNATSLNMALLQRDQLKIKELMDQMCMSMVKLQGRLQFSQARAGDGGSASSSSSSSSDEASEESADPGGPPVPSAAGGKVVTIAKGPERRRSLNAWMQQRSAQRGTAVKRTTQVGAVSQALFNKDNEDLMPEAKRKFDMKLRAQLAKVVLSFPFEVAFGALICANTIVMAFQSEYNGLETGYNEGFDGIDRAAKDLWPGAEDAFSVFEYFFGILFTIEIVMKLGVLYHHFFKDLWNIMDFAVVAVWYLETFTGSDNLPIHPMMLRLFRLVKLSRVVRLVRILEKYDALYLMIASIRGSVAALAWSTILLLVVQMMLALFMTTILEAYFMNESWSGDKMEVFQYYGTFSRSLLTMFEITLANFIPVTRSLITNVSQVYFVFAMMHKFFIGLAVVMVITGVFIQETMKVAQTDNNIMLQQRERSNKLHTRKIKALFDLIDADGSGQISSQDFTQICQDESMKMWLSAMGLDVSDAGGVFDLICEQLDGETLSAKELVNGVSRLKGPARNIDMALLRSENMEILKRVNQLQATLNEIGESIEVDF